MKTLTKVAAVSASVAFAGLALTPAFADSPGQIEGGNIFQARNLTANTGYADPASANACEELKYSITLHNPDFGQVSNLLVKVSLPAAASTKNVANMTATYTGGTINSTSDTATVNLSSSQSISLESGSAVLLDGQGNKISAVSDSLVNGGGASLGSLAGSGLEYVQFLAKVSCPQPPAPVFTCDELNVTTGDNRTVSISAFNVTAKNGATFKNADVAWGDNSSDKGLTTVVGKSHQYAADGTYTIAATAHFTVNDTDKTATSAACEKVVTFKTNTPPTVTPPTPTTPATPTQLVNTGAGNVIGIFAAVTAAAAAAYRFSISRRLSRQ